MIRPFSTFCITAMMVAWAPTIGFAQVTQQDARQPEQPATDTAVTHEQMLFFERHVRPLLVEHCFECHSGEKLKGSLSLESREDLLLGGDSGPAITPGDPEDSLLIQAIHYEGLEMPPLGKLPDKQIEWLSSWIRDGAPWPGAASVPAAKRHEQDSEITALDRQHWAFQPVGPVELPKQDWKGNPIDAFIESGLDAAGLTPNPPASTDTVIRRVFFGLTGLPPSYDELQHWAERIGGDDRSPDDAHALEQLIDELLSRPTYGEYWARHWLDVVRFAQSNGYERDGYKPNSWRYRDYVVRAFQQDKPYDRFVLEQLAGDELPDSDSESRIATGFYRLGVWDDEPDDSRQAEFDELDDVLVTMGATFMGLTIGCARCHDHKFDPIPQADYYRLLAFLRNVRRYENPDNVLGSGTVLPLGEEQEVRRVVESLQQRLQEKQKAIAAAVTDEEKQQAESQQVDLHLTGLDWTLAVRENPGDPPPTHVLIRGSAGTPGPTVEPGFPQVFSPVPPQQPAETATSQANDDVPVSPSQAPLNDLFPSSGRRLTLARWIADPENPLTARVMVNRVWHYHFGRGLVTTTGDFGRAGHPPSHPELLDWLARDFVNNGWSIKRLHRLILTSEAYRRSSQIDLERAEHQLAATKDPDNRLLWRFALRRLQGGAIRDRMLFSSGELNLEIGGREFYPQLSGEVLAGQSKPGLGWEVSAQSEQLRRSLYAMVKRSVSVPFLEAFDYSNTTSPLTERPTTTVATQALILLHGRFTAERADKLAQQLCERTNDRDQQISELYRSVLQREPTATERQICLDSLAQFEAESRERVGQVSFRPDVPVSLFSGYRQSLSGDDFLLGPIESFDYRSGRWGGGYEGIDVVDPRLGPHAFWKGGPFRNGTLRGRVRFAPGVELVTLIARGRPLEDAWQGLGITLDRKRGVAEARLRSQQDEQVASAAAAMPANVWIPFRWQIDESHSRFWIGEDPSDAATVEQPIASTAQEAGRLGFAVWGGQVDIQSLEWIPDPAEVPTNLDGQVECLDLGRTRWVGGTAELPTGWSRYGGDWQRQGDGTWLVQPSQGAKILWDTQPVGRGEVSVEMQMTPGRSQIGGLLLCVSDPNVGADNWYGYEVSLNAEAQTVFVGDHRHNYRQLEQAPAAVKPGEWHKLRAVLSEERLQVFVDDQPKPSIDLALTDRLQGELAGLRTWGSEIRFRHFTVRQGDNQQRADWPAPVLQHRSVAEEDAWVRQQALAALCRTVFSLNEFVYVE